MYMYISSYKRMYVRTYYALNTLWLLLCLINTNTSMEELTVLYCLVVIIVVSSFNDQNILMNMKRFTCIYKPKLISSKEKPVKACKRSSKSINSHKYLMVLIVY